MSTRIAVPSGLLLLSLAACTHAPATVAPAEPALDYVLAIPAGPVTALEIRLSLAGDPDGATTLEMPAEWGGVRGVHGFVHELEARGAEGGTLPVGRDTNGHWRVTHRPGEALRIRYVLRNGPLPEDASITERVFRPRFGDDGVRIIGDLALLHPAHVTGTALIRLRWEGAESRGWTMLTSHGEGATVERRMTLDSFRHALFLAGTDRVHRGEVEGRPVVFTMRGGGWNFADDALVTQGLALVRAQRDYFADHAQRFFLVALEPNPVEGNIGTGLTDSFALFVPAGAKLEGSNGIAQLLAHELLHNWIGGPGFGGEREELSYWFTEGFTTHVARRIALRTGLFDERAFVADFNAALQAYWQNPRRDASNETVRAEFWTDPNVRKLAYQRGDLLATLVAARLREAKDGQRLDDLVRTIIARARRGESVDHESLLAALERFTDAAFVAHARRLLDGQDSLLPPVDAFGPCVERTTTRTTVRELGFDVERSVDARRLIGVRAGGAAQRAGLQEGQPFASFQVVPHGAGRAFELQMTSEDGTRPVRVVPDAIDLELPAFSFKGESPGAPCRLAP